MTSKNCTQFKSNLNRLKIESDEEFYILFDINIMLSTLKELNVYQEAFLKSVKIDSHINELYNISYRKKCFIDNPTVG